MEELTARVNEALGREEIRAERFANRIRLIFLSLLAVIAAVNINNVGRVASYMNFGTLATGFLYGFIVHLVMRKRGYHPSMKYITSLCDIFLIHALLFLYTQIEIPSVALKNYVFYVVYPIILLTVFRYDRKLTLLAGLWAVVLYLTLLVYLSLTRSAFFEPFGYYDELFSPRITVVAQLTKVTILCGYIALATYLSHYSRKLILAMIRQEVSARSEKEAMVRELEVASEVQRRLLPRTFPSMPKLETYGMVLPGQFVGGDYFDFLRVNDTSLLLVIADVSGKGVPAALIMSEVRASVHLLADMSRSLEELVKRLNTLVHTSTARHDFVTFFVAEVSSLRPTIRYVNAGHPPPIVALNGVMEQLSERTLALGFMEDLPNLREQTASFQPGSLLVAYTDGILERTNPQREQYGLERLQEFIRGNAALPAEAFAERLVEDVKSFGDGHYLDDDATVAVVRRIV